MSDSPQNTSGKTVTIRLPSLSGIRSRLHLPRPAVGKLGQGRWRTALIVTILLVAIGDVLLMRQSSQQDDVVDARAAALTSAEVRLPVMLSYNYRNLDANLSVASGNATGKFRDEFTGVLESVVRPNAIKKKITTKAEVVGASVVDSSGNDVDLLLFISQSTTEGNAKKPTTTGSRIAVRMTKTADGWFVSSITPV